MSKNPPKWIQTIAAVAPAIASGFLSPVAGLAVNAFFKSLGKTPPKTGGEAAALKAAQVIAENLLPDDLKKLRTADQPFKKEIDENTDIDLDQYKVDLAKIEADDRADAREMGEKTGQKPQIVLSGCVMVLFSITLIILLRTPAPPDIALVLGGIVGSALTQVLNYWFGTSKSSSDKNKMLATAGNR